MVTTIKVLKRRDASSVIVAIVIAMIVGQLLAMTTMDLSQRLSGANQSFGYDAPSISWKFTYLQPIISAVLQFILLEIVVWLYVTIKASMNKK